MKEYARKPGRGTNDELAATFREVCKVFETRTRCEKCWTNPTKHVQGTGATGARRWVALCSDCSEAQPPLKRTSRVTLDDARRRIREIESSDRVTLPDMIHRIRAIERGE